MCLNDWKPTPAIADQQWRIIPSDFDIVIMAEMCFCMLGNGNPCMLVIFLVRMHLHQELACFHCSRT